MSKVMKVKLKSQEEDFYLNENGYSVFTSTFLKRRGYCCGNGCLHCPYEYEGVKDLALRKELQSRKIR
jgi:hypothetical protein